jgi:hypothetical protein
MVQAFKGVKPPNGLKGLMLWKTLNYSDQPMAS